MVTGDGRRETGTFRMVIGYRSREVGFVARCGARLGEVG